MQHWRASTGVRVLFKLEIPSTLHSHARRPVICQILTVAGPQLFSSSFHASPAPHDAVDVASWRWDRQARRARVRKGLLPSKDVIAPRPCIVAVCFRVGASQKTFCQVKLLQIAHRGVEAASTTACQPRRPLDRMRTIWDISQSPATLHTLTNIARYYADMPNS